MDFITTIQSAISVISLTHVWLCGIGVLIGFIVGVIPGIGALTAMSLLMPLTYHFDLISSLLLLSGIWYGSMYGGSIPSILLNIPGTPATAITCAEGYPMGQQGRSLTALVLQASSSFAGGIFGVLVVILCTEILSKLGLHFQSADYAILILFLLIFVCFTYRANFSKNMSMVLSGMILASVGIDANTGYTRGTFDILYLQDGITVVVLLIGLFGLSEVLWQCHHGGTRSTNFLNGSDSFGRAAVEVLRTRWSTLRGSIIGTIVGALPATGPTLAASLAYVTEKSLSKNPGKFGKGAAEGVAAPEAANNAASHTCLIPTLALGIPGDVAMIFVLAAFMIQGVAVGPTFFSAQADVFWILILSFFAGNVFMLILSFLVIPWATRILNIPGWIIYPSVIIFCCFAAYSVRFLFADVIMMALFGLLGYTLRRCGFDLIPLVFGFIMTPTLETNLRRALLLGDGDFSVFFHRPLLMIILTCMMIVIFIVYRRSLKND